MGLAGGDGGKVGGSALVVVLAVEVVLVALEVGPAREFGGSLSLRPFPVLPFCCTVVLCGVTSLPPGGTSRVVRVVVVVPITWVPLPIRLWRCGAEWLEGGANRVLGAGAVPSDARGLVVEVVVIVSGRLGRALGS